MYKFRDISLNILCLKVGISGQEEDLSPITKQLSRASVSAIKPNAPVDIVQKKKSDMSKDTTASTTDANSTSPNNAAAGSPTTSPNSSPKRKMSTQSAKSEEVI
jgi:hypothetical protein